MIPILPGSTIGILGSGQLGRMLAIEARKMGYKVATLSPEQDSPTGQIADKEVVANYNDLDAIRAFAAEVDAITFEFENVSSEATRVAEQIVAVHPAGRVLHTTQHRIREKNFLAGAGIPIAPYAHITSLESLRDAAERIGYPCVLKTAGFGYDGKGQVKLKSPNDLEAAWSSVNGAESVLEGFIDFRMEISVVAARSQDGGFVHYGALENIHRNHILDITISPARITDRLANEAAALAANILEKLDVVGVMCVEMFVTSEDSILVNELAPRPHNSGHFTFDACVTSQFEQQLRAVCGLPLGSPQQLRPAVMVNLLGDVWEHGEPHWEKALAVEGVKLHLYGKSEPRKGRKMGHITALAATAEEALENALMARDALQGG